MVSTSSFIMMGITCFVCFIVPLVLIWWLRKRYQASITSFLTGMIAFVVAVQVIEAPINYYFLVVNGNTSSWLTQPVIYSLYGGLMAGIFEETARYLCFRFCLKKQTRLQDSLSYGVGHGGIEAMLIVGTTYISNIVISLFINHGLIENLGFSTALEQSITEQLTMVSPIIFGVAGYERLMTLIIQIGLSVLVFKAVRERKIKYYLFAILLHASLDLPAALYQLGKVNLIATEGLVTLFAIGFLVFIFRQIKRYKEDLSIPDDQELQKYQKAGY